MAASTANHSRMIGPNRAATLAVPRALHGKQADQDRDRQRHHRLLEGGSDDLETLHRRYDGKRRRNGSVAVEERCAGDAEQQQHVLAALGHRLRQCHQREGAALAVEVRPQKNEDVLERHEQEQRPHDQREDAQHVSCTTAASPVAATTASRKA